MQQLVALAELTSLSLEEGTLTLAAFDFVDRLPKLAYLGVQEVQLGKRDLKALRRRLPGVRVNP